MRPALWASCYRQSSRECPLLALNRHRPVQRTLSAFRGKADMAGAKRSKARIALATLGVAVVIYGLTAYVVLPRAWTHYEHQKGLAGLTMVTRTSQEIPGDPINVGLVGTREDVLCVMHAAGWYPADPITFRSS